MRTLHNRLRDYELRRRNTETDDGETFQARIRIELDGPGRIRGYRAKWHTLHLDYGIQAPRRKMEIILRQVGLAKGSYTYEKGVPSRPEFCLARRRLR